MPSLFEENLNPADFSSFAEFVEATALGKCIEVADRLRNDEKPPDLIIAGDTVVTLNGKVYGKPKKPDVAFEMLKELAGLTHVVYTGVVLKHKDTVVKFTVRRHMNSPESCLYSNIDFLFHFLFIFSGIDQGVLRSSWRTTNTKLR